MPWDGRRSARQNAAAMIHARHDTSRRVLLVGEAVTLAHVARPIALARKLVARGYRPILAADPRFAALCPAGEWDTKEIRSIPSADFLRALARGKPVYDLATLERYVEDDLALLQAVSPAVVIGDFRISLAVSARLSGKTARVPAACPAHASPGTKAWPSSCRRGTAPRVHRG